MGFISLIIMGTFLVFMAIGAVQLLIAFIIFLTRFIRKKRNAKVGKISKIVAILFLVLGILSEMPFIFLLIFNGVFYVEEAIEFARLENKYQVGTEALQDEFVYQGNTLVYVEELRDDTEDGDPDTTFEANLIYKNSNMDHDYSELDKIKNESPYEIYRVYNNDKTYVKKEDREKVIDFYHNQAHYRVGITCKHSEDIEEYYEISRPKMDEIISNGEKEMVYSSDVIDTYCFDVISEDELCGVTYKFILLKDDTILYRGKKSGEKIEAYRLTDDGLAYINECREKIGY